MPLEYEFGQDNYEPGISRQDKIEKQLDTIFGLLMQVRTDIDRLKGDTGNTNQLTIRTPISQTQKGDLFTSDGSTNQTTLIRIPVGAEGFVLTAISAATGGMDWRSPNTQSIGTLQAIFNLLPRA